MMKLECEDLGGMKYKLTIEVGFAEIQKQRARLAKTYGSRVQVKGFRPGKVPVDLLIKQLGPEFEIEVQEYIISSAFDEALTKHSLKPSIGPKFEHLEPSEKGAKHFSVEFEVYPNIVMKDYLGIEAVQPVIPEVTQDDIDGTLERMRQSRGKYDDRPEDSVAVENDMVVADVELLAEDGETVLQERRETRIMVGSDDEPIVEIGRAILGMKAGETKDVPGKIGRLASKVLEVPKPKDAKAEKAEEEGAEAAEEEVAEAAEEEAAEVPENGIARVEIKRVLVKKVPELDDEFAKEFGENMTLEQLKNEISERLIKDREEQLKVAWQESVITALIEANPMEFGEATVLRVAEAAIAESLEQMLPQMSAQERAKLAESMPKEQGIAEAKRNLARAIILQTVAEQEGVEVGAEEIDQYLLGIAAQYGEPLARLKGQLNQEQYESIARRLQLDKVMDMLQRYAVAKAPSAPEAEGEAKTAEELPEAAGEDETVEPAPEVEAEDSPEAAPVEEEPNVEE